MILPFEADKTFNCPPGNHRATLYEVREQQKATKDGTDVFIRFVFRMDDVCSESKEVVTGKNFVPTLSQGGDLRLMLEIWLGEKFVEEQHKTGNWNLKTLEGQKADLVIRHIKNRGYKKPFVNIEQILAPGTLISIPQIGTEPEMEAEASI